RVLVAEHRIGGVAAFAARRTGAGGGAADALAPVGLVVLVVRASVARDQHADRAADPGAVGRPVSPEVVVGGAGALVRAVHAVLAARLRPAFARVVAALGVARIGGQAIHATVVIGAAHAELFRSGDQTRP